MSYKPGTTNGMFVAVAIFYLIVFISTIIIYLWIT